MTNKETKLNIILAGQKAVEELIKVAQEKIVDSGEDISADRLEAKPEAAVCIHCKTDE